MPPRHGSILRGREAAKKLSATAFDSCFVDWSGRAPYTLWPSQASTEKGLREGETVDKPWLEIIADFVEHAEGPPLPKGTGPVISFGVSKNGDSNDADWAAVTWILLDDDAAGDLTDFVEFLLSAKIAFIAQRRGEKWHLQLPLAHPIIPKEPLAEYKKKHVAQMEWVMGLFSELAELKLDLNAVNDKGQEKPIYGFDAAIPRNRICGICYPYARRVESDEVPETFWGEGRALDFDALLAASGFEFSPGKTTPRTITLEEKDGRLAALSRAGMIRSELDKGYALVCPWSTDITSKGHEPGAMTSTVLFHSGVWHCSHETCKGVHTWRDVDTWLEDNNPEAYAEAWMSSLTRNEKGAVKSGIHNVLTLLRYHPAWKGLLRYDVRRMQPILTRDPPWGGEPTWNDAFITQAAGWLSRHYGIEGNLTHSALGAVAWHNSFDPVVDYLERLVWDKKPRIDTWLIDYCKASDTPYHREIGKNWLISAVARAFDPGCQADHMLIFESTQGQFKTSVLRKLGGPWYADPRSTIKGQKGIEAIQGKWIIEMPELSATKGADIEDLKAYLSATSDDYRPPWGRAVVDNPRRCVFAGSTNDLTYLDDVENRRFWPVATGVCDADAVQRDRNQLFAEAVVRYRAGEKWHITDEAIKRDAAEAQAARRYVNPWEDRTAVFLKNKTITTTHNVMGNLGIELRDQSRHYKQVGRIVNALGWHSRVIMRPGSDMQQRYLVRRDGTEIRWSDLPEISVGVPVQAAKASN